MSLLLRLLLLVFLATALFPVMMRPTVRAAGSSTPGPCLSELNLAPGSSSADGFYVSPRDAPGSASVVRRRTYVHTGASERRTGVARLRHPMRSGRARCDETDETYGSGARDGVMNRWITASPAAR